MTVNLSLLAGAGAQFFDNNGIPLAGGLVYTYTAGTTTPQAAYTTSAGSIAHANPIVLDSSGRIPSGGEIWLTDAVAYKFVLKTATATTIGTYDNVTGNASGIYAAFAASSGSSLVGFIQAGTGAVATTVQTKLRQYVSVKDFGAVGNGTTNDTAAIQAALDYANTLGNAALMFEPGVYKCNTGLTLYPNTVAVKGNGAKIDFSGMTTGYAISFSQSITDANIRNAVNKAHPISDLYMIGPTGSVSVTAVKAIDQNPISGAYWLSGITFNSCSFANFKRCVEFGNGSFLFTFYACSFYTLSGTGYDYCLYQPSGGSNYGENNEFIACYFGITIGSVYLQQNGNATTYFRGCSFDYAANVLYVQAGTIYCDGYIESNTDTDYWIKVSGANTIVRLSGQVTVSGNKSTYELFYCDSTVTTGGLVLDANIEFGGGVTYTPTSRNLVSGTGRTLCRYVGSSQSTVHPAIGGGLNFLANGGFESASLTDWTLTGTTPPARSTAQAHAGTYSLAFTGSSTNTPAATRNIPCEPGQMFTGGLWYYCNNITGTSGTFYIQYNFLDAGGTSISGGSNLTVTTNQGTSWLYLQLSPQVAAPAGTVNVQLGISVFGTVSGSPVAYIDDVTLAVV